MSDYTETDEDDNSILGTLDPRSESSTDTGDGDGAETASQARETTDTAIGRLISLYFRATDRVASLIWGLSVITGAVLVAVVAGQVVTRYLFNWVPAWGGELSRYLMIWIALLLTGVLVTRDKHLQVEFIFQRLPLTVQRVIRSIQLVIVCLLGLFFTFIGLNYAITSGTYSTSPALGFYMYWMYIAFPISGLLIMLYSTRKLIEINYWPNTLQEDYQSRFGAYSDDLDIEEGK